MKKMNQRQIFCISGMIFCMLATDILICFQNNFIQKIGYVGLIGVVIFAIFYAIETHKKHQKEDEETIKKLLQKKEGN